MTDQAKESAVCAPWVAFRSLLDRLARGMPAKIDRGVFRGVAWKVQGQLVAGLKFLGLMNGEEEPTGLLRDLVKGTDVERRQKLRFVIEDRYAELIAMDLQEATLEGLAERMAELYSVKGEALERAMSFFLSAAEFVGLPRFPFLRPVRITRLSRKPKRMRASAGHSVSSALALSNSLSSSSGSTSTKHSSHVVRGEMQGTSKSVQLKSGGTLTLWAAIDLFRLSTSDRQFVFELIDKLEEYAT